MVFSAAAHLMLEEQNTKDIMCAADNNLKNARQQKIRKLLIKFGEVK